MESGNTSIIYHLFEKESPEQIEDQKLNSLLAAYPYFSHLHLLKAIKEKCLDDDLSKLGIYSFYPTVSYAALSRGNLDSFEKINFAGEDSEEKIKKEEQPEPQIKTASEQHNPQDAGLKNTVDNELIETSQNHKTKGEEKTAGEEEKVRPMQNDETDEKLIAKEEKKEEENLKTVESPVSAIQPLYTEDYFAYTQTKLPEDLEDDKPPTMDQVNSFTGWLRMMKKSSGNPPQEDLTKEKEEEEEEITEKEREEKIVEDTENENPKDIKGIHNEEVITESMAKIWVDHGYYEKAKRIYKKLILLNPEKKTYFAAKIKELKEL